MPVNITGFTVATVTLKCPIDCNVICKSQGLCKRPKCANTGHEGVTDGLSWTNMVYTAKRYDCCSAIYKTGWLHLVIMCADLFHNRVWGFWELLLAIHEVQSSALFK